jgi:peptide/nickel transport system substrate-binding protein
MRARSILLGAVAGAGLAATAAAERGSDGQLSILYWQAPSIMNPYLSGGTKDVEAASLVLEPLARYDETGKMVPWLAREIPTVENGGVAPDFTAITWTLKADLAWSDGTPVTADDVRFTWRYCTAEGGGCAQRDKYDGITAIETPDARTVVVRFDAPKPFPYAAFVGAQAPILQKAQFEGCLGPRAPACTRENFHPVGTGPYVVDEFRPNDVIRFSANPAYRAPGKPAFAEVRLKGGGDATAAARAVLETGEVDYAWNLQMAPEVLADMEAGGKGEVIAGFGTLVERIMINLTDPDPRHGARRSTRDHPHPALTDPAVRRALSMAIDRELLVDIGYGEAGRVTCNILPAPEIYASTANDACKVQDIAGARAVLEAAGWTDSDGDGVRDKDGVALRLLFQTSTNAVRQDFQALIKQWWGEIGVETRLRNIDASVFFGGDPASPDTFQKFYADVQMYAGAFDGTDPEAYMASWQCDRIPAPENQWQGTNVPRYCNPDYDALAAEMRGAGAPERRAELARAMNDTLMQDHVMLPLVNRGRVSAKADSLGGVVLNTWDSELWNIADWYRKDAD